MTPGGRIQNQICLFGRVLVFFAEIVLVDLAVKGSLADSEDFSRFASVPLHHLKGVSNQLLLQLLDRRPYREAAHTSANAVRPNMAGEIFDLENLAGTGDDHVLDGILQLSDISGPRIPGENPKGIP